MPRGRVSIERGAGQASPAAGTTPTNGHIQALTCGSSPPRRCRTRCPGICVTAEPTSLDQAYAAGQFARPRDLRGELFVIVLREQSQRHRQIRRQLSRHSAGDRRHGRRQPIASHPTVATKDPERHPIRTNQHISHAPQQDGDRHPQTAATPSSPAIGSGRKATKVTHHPHSDRRCLVAHRKVTKSK